MCIELELTEEQVRTAKRLKLAADHGSDKWLERVAKAVNGLGGPLAGKFCDLAGVP